MTLYNYVNGREGLEDLVVDAIISSLELPDPTNDLAGRPRCDCDNSVGGISCTSQRNTADNDPPFSLGIYVRAS